MAGRVDEAKAVVRRFHDLSHEDEQHFALAEFYQMQKQTEYDRTLDSSWLQMVKKPSYRKRAILAFGFSFLSQSTAILGKKPSQLAARPLNDAAVINNYGSILYKALGYDTSQQLKLQCGWIAMGLSGNIVGKKRFLNCRTETI